MLVMKEKRRLKEGVQQGEIHNKQIRKQIGFFNLLSYLLQFTRWLLLFLANWDEPRFNFTKSNK